MQIIPPTNDSFRNKPSHYKKQQKEDILSISLCPTKKSERSAICPINLRNNIIYDTASAC